jgi:hypothetical protein
MRTHSACRWNGASDWSKGSAHAGILHRDVSTPTTQYSPPAGVWHLADFGLSLPCAPPPSPSAPLHTWPATLDYTLLQSRSYRRAVTDRRYLVTRIHGTRTDGQPPTYGEATISENRPGCCAARNADQRYQLICPPGNRLLC